MNTRITQALKKASNGVLNENLKLNGDTLYYGHSSVSIEKGFFVHAAFINLEADPDESLRVSSMKSHCFKMTNAKFASQLLYMAKKFNKLDQKFLNSLEFITKQQVCEMPFVISDEALKVLLKAFNLLLDKSFTVTKKSSMALCHRPYNYNKHTSQTPQDLVHAEICIYQLKGMFS